MSTAICMAKRMAQKMIHSKIKHLQQQDGNFGNPVFVPAPECTVASGDCFHEGQCLAQCGRHALQAGWKCSVCGKGNAPFQALCANENCGRERTN